MIATAPKRPSSAKAMKKLPKDVDLDRLGTAIEGARRTLMKFREERVRAVRELVGWHYSDGGTDLPVPVNLLQKYVEIMSAALVSQDPRFSLSTMDSSQRAAVDACEAWMNREAEAMYLGDALHRIVIDALFSVGICKVALTTPGDSANSGWSKESGQPGAWRIDLDDWVYDVAARDFREVSFIGHRYRVPLAAAEAMYKDLDEDDAAENTDYNRQGDEKIDLVGRGTMYAEEFEEMVTLWEIYLPRHGLVLTLSDDTTGDEGNGLVRVQEWVGPPCGPYHILAFNIVPGAAMPKGPVMDLIDLHKAVNRQYRQLIEDTDRWKAIGVVPSGGEDDAKRFMDAKNGEWIKHDRPDTIKEVQTGGPGQGVFMMAQHLKDLFSWLAGNLDIVGGLSPQSKTAHQDEMLNQNANRSVGDKQGRVVTFASSVGKALAWYYWNHPEKVMKAPYEAPGLPELSVVRKVYPAGAMRPDGRPQRLRRYGDVPDVRVDPYSLSHSTPQQRLAFLNGFIQNSQPMMPLWAQQGVVMDAHEYVAIAAKLGDSPDLLRLFSTGEPMEKRGGDGGGGEMGGMPANTSREYIRRSMGGGDSKGAQAATMDNAASGMNGVLGAGTE